MSEMVTKVGRPVGSCGLGAALQLLLYVLIALTALSMSATADADTHFKDKTITLFVGYASGGGYDTYSRTFAKHFPRHIPGSPSVVVKNQPGAGSIKLANYLFNAAPKNGEEIGVVGREIPTATLLKVQNTQFESSRFNWIGSLASGKKFCVTWHDTPIATYKDLFETEFIVGGSTGESPTLLTPRILNRLLGMKIHVIAGYPGGAEMYLAMERGEIQGRCPVTTASLNASRPDWIRDKKVRFLLEISLSDKREFADIPVVTEFTKSEDDAKILEFLLAPEEWQRPLAAPPGLAAEIVAILRASFEKTMVDPAYVSDVERQNFDGGPMSGVEMERRITRLESMPDSLVKAAIGVASPTGSAK